MKLGDNEASAFYSTPKELNTLRIELHSEFSKSYIHPYPKLHWGLFILNSFRVFYSILNIRFETRFPKKEMRIQNPERIEC